MVKKVQLPGFECEKCHQVFIGADKYKEAREHEKDPIRRTPALNGLLVKRSIFLKSRALLSAPAAVYTVILDSGRVNTSHQALYVWHDYNRRSLTEILPEEDQGKFSPFAEIDLSPREFRERGLIANGFKGILGRVLYTFNGKDSYKNYRDWKDGEFERTAKALKEKHKELYDGVEFKRKAPLGIKR